MDFLDFFFPQQAQASYLRDLANSSQQQARLMHRERFQREMERMAEDSRVVDLEKRVAQLEKNLGQAGLVIEALMELLEESRTLSRTAVAERTTEIDARDGSVDGKQTPPTKEPFEPKRKWPGQRDGWA